MKPINLSAKSLEIVLFGTLLFILSSCGQSPEKPNTFDLEQAKGEIEVRLRAYEDALKKEDVVALGNLYTTDAQILHNGRPATVGRENLIKAFKGFVRDSATSSGFTTTGLWGNNELLVEQGVGFFAHSEGKWKSTGSYLLVWKKVDGEWKIFRDTWFNDEK